jgi:AraC-like DNA-binding protein/uncharacterized cupin superfamily protein
VIIYSNTNSCFMFLDHFGRETKRASHGYWCSTRHRQNPDGAIIQYVCEGELVHEHGGLRRTAQAGQALLMLAGDDTEYGLARNSAVDGRYQWVELRGPGARDHLAQIIERYGPIATDSPQRELLHAMERLIAVGSQYAVRDPAQAALAVYAFLLHLHTHMARETDELAGTPVYRAMAQLAANPLHPWSLEELADEVGCSRDHLTRSFTARFGLTPKRWLLERRLEVALRLLSTSSISVAAIAEQTGLGSAHTVARLVREATGRSPQAYRERQQARAARPLRANTR